MCNSSLPSNVKSCHSSRIRRKYSLTKQGAVFFRGFWLCYFHRGYFCFFSTLQQTIASNSSQPMKTTTASKDFINHWGRLWVSPCAVHARVLCWGLSASLWPCSYVMHTGAWSPYFVPYVTSVFYCYKKLEVLKLQFVPAKGSCWLRASQSPRLLSSIFLIVSELCTQVWPITRKPFLLSRQQ